MAGGNKVTDTQAFIKMQQFTRPVNPQPIAERQFLPQGQYNLSYSKTYPNQKYGLLVNFSREAMKDNQYRSTFIQTWTTDLLDNCHQVRDQSLVNEWFNLANSNTGPDGVSYINTAHPLEASAAELTDDGKSTFSNEIANDPTVSTAALNAGVSILKRQRDSKGNIMAAMPPVVVECSDIREVIWLSIKSPVNGYEYGTTDRNSGGVYSRMISEVLGLTRAQHNDWFMLRTANSKKQKRFIWDRETPSISELEYCKKDDTFEGNVIFRLAKGVFDWRGVVGSIAGS